jgi:HAE1 family hydrophobic/amphiphilic exporter-1
MDEVGGALIADRSCALCRLHPHRIYHGHFGLFLPTVRLTIAAATIISAMVSLTLSPALAALFLRPA